MFLADYHMHCTPFSPDAHDKMLTMAEVAHTRGITEICFTNHIDNCSLSSDPPWASYDDPEPQIQELRATQERLGGAVELHLGAEISSPHYVPEEGARLYNLGFDFVIGSIHNLRGKKDFYFYNYPPLEVLRPELEIYLNEHLGMVMSGCCDVLGHIGYMQKYMSKQDKFFDMMEFSDRLRELFKLCVQRGVGIEVNTSALGSPLRDFMPNRNVLELYRECGGEIITVGSDSHCAADAGAGIADAYELLRTCGFSYVTVFRQHKPEFRKL